MKFVKIEEPQLGINRHIKMIVRYDHGAYAGSLHKLREDWYVYVCGDTSIGERHYASMEAAERDLIDIYFIEGL